MHGAPVSARLHCGEGNFADIIKVPYQFTLSYPKGRFS